MKIKIKDRTELKTVYSKNKALTTPSKKEAAQRGYELEAILEFLMMPYELRASYKGEGEQIDGSFFIWGQTFLLEAKWLNVEAAASSLYAFKGKVDGKFHTTSGIYLSMKGYSKDSANALRYGKTINVLLFNGEDLDYMIEKDVPFEDVLKFKLRQAGDLGVPNAPYKLTTKAASLATQTPVLSGTTITISPSISPSNQSAYLVFYPSSFKSYQVQSFFTGLQTKNIEPFRFYEIQDNENPLDTISVIVNVNEASYDAPDVRGILVFIDERKKSSDQEVQLRLNLPEVIEESNHGMPLGIFTMSPNYLETAFDDDRNSINTPLKEILKFLEDGMQTNNFFFDDNAIYPAIKKVLNSADWNFEKKEVTLYDTYDESPTTIRDYSTLVYHLEEIAKQTAGDNTPSSILKEQGYPDYEDEVQEILQQYPQVKKIGWL